MLRGRAVRVRPRPSSTALRMMVRVMSLSRNRGGLGSRRPTRASPFFHAAKDGHERAEGAEIGIDHQPRRGHRARARGARREPTPRKQRRALSRSGRASRNRQPRRGCWAGAPGLELLPRWSCRCVCAQADWHTGSSSRRRRSAWRAWSNPASSTAAPAEIRVVERLPSRRLYDDDRWACAVFRSTRSDPGGRGRGGPPCVPRSLSGIEDACQIEVLRRPPSMLNCPRHWPRRSSHSGHQPIHSCIRSKEIALVIGRDQQRCEIRPVAQPCVPGAGVLAHDLLQAVGLYRGQWSIAPLKEAREPVGKPSLTTGIDLGLQGIEPRGSPCPHRRIAAAKRADSHFHPGAIVEDEDPRTCAAGHGHQESRQHGFPRSWDGRRIRCMPP